MLLKNVFISLSIVSDTTIKNGNGDQRNPKLHTLEILSCTIPHLSILDCCMSAWRGKVTMLRTWTEMIHTQTRRGRLWVLVDRSYRKDATIWWKVVWAWKRTPASKILVRG